MTEKPAAKDIQDLLGATTLPSPAAAKAAQPKPAEPKIEPKVEPKVGPKIEPPPAPPAPAVDPVEQARTLWRKAIDSEISGDFREAVKCYEQIKKLPTDVQPEGLDLRLEQAKKQIKK